jgi:hypothetical protein
LVQTDEERKAKKRKYDLEYRSRPKVKERKKKYFKRDDVRARKKELESRPEVKEKRRIKQKEYLARPEVKERTKERSRNYYQRTEVKEKIKKHRKTPEAKAKRKIYRNKPEIKEKEKKQRDDNRFNILQVYSKRLSNSNIPCCNCCGENYHVDFLAIDHIRGSKQMDLEPELKKLKYSSKFTTWKLQDWIIKNNFPSGFQILCHNCNFAKGMLGRNNKCPHEK